MNKMSMLLFLLILLLFSVANHSRAITSYTFVVSDTSTYNRLCSEKSILTVNGLFPGPTITANMGETFLINIINNATDNITIHWHGVKQPQNPWFDGTEYITQCPIQSGGSFNQTVVLSDEIGTLWWHAHSDWSRATVHGALIVKPHQDESNGHYPFNIPQEEIPIILGEWWKNDVNEVLSESLRSGGDPNLSDAFLINGQPGDLYSCSKQDTFKLSVEFGKTYLLRIINAVLSNIMFFGIANHTLTVVGSDGAYLKPFATDHISISPGQTIDCLLEANQQPSRYYMAARVYASEAPFFDSTTTTAVVDYLRNQTAPSSPLLPSLPAFNNTLASADFTGKFRSLADEKNPINVPSKPDTTLLFTLSLNTEPCVDNNCSGPFGNRLLASVNNVTFRLPESTSILEAYYKRTTGVYDSDFPSDPPFDFNYTADVIPRDLWRAKRGTKARVLEYNSTVEIVFQGTNMVGGTDHPTHLHGQSFYVVGWGFGNFDEKNDPWNYNLVDPPLMNTVAVPINGWTAIRFKAYNPGVWLMHCHVERHMSWGMEMVFITKNGNGSGQELLPPPTDLPKC